jgi:hypothetical protein
MARERAKKTHAMLRRKYVVRTGSVMVSMSSCSAQDEDDGVGTEKEKSLIYYAKKLSLCEMISTDG